jgi:Dyp-type peroxidase family
MPIDLAKPLAWTKASEAEKRMLCGVQGNILKAHGCPVTANIFFRIEGARKESMRAALRELAACHLTSAYRQLADGTRPSFVSVFLSAGGYLSLGVSSAETPADLHFRARMRNADLGDPPLDAWERGFQESIDGMVLVGGENDRVLQSKRETVVGILAAGGAAIVHEQAGRQLFNRANEPIEHFGYVDGRSQPLPLVEDLSAEGAASYWNPQVPLSAALVREPGSTDGFGYGSYIVFRKLEQNVRGFKRMEQTLASAMALSGAARKLAGAMAIGRFEDGTPMTLSQKAGALGPVNDFNYASDPGIRAPYCSHMRKMNPRGSSLVESADEERKHLMVRRGIPYEDERRLLHPADVPGSESVAEFDETIGPLLPSGGVGLLFMAYNSDLGQQFEFVQKHWANARNFPRAHEPAGIDPLMGQGRASPHRWPRAWNDPAKGSLMLPFEKFVTMRGGEYFFAPSLRFLGAL